MANVTKKQREYRKALIEKKVTRLADAYDNRVMMEAFIAANLPEPKDRQDASAQISALKTSLKKYANSNPEWFSSLTQDDLEAFASKVKEAKNSWGKNGYERVETLIKRAVLAG